MTARTTENPGNNPAPRTGASPALAGHATDPITLFERVCAHIGFDAEDSALLAAFHPKVEPHLHAIVDDFYARILADPAARRVLTGGHRQVERLKGTLLAWLERVLKGPHDAEFAVLQSRIGAAHVRVGLEQSHMVTGMHVLREHLNRIFLEACPRRTPRSAATQRAIFRVLDVALALMLETYREAMLRRLLQAEQNATMRRLAALGEVATSIAHEIRNPLAGISGAIQVLQVESRPDDPRQEILREILHEIQRLDERVNDLLLYARPSPLIREPVKAGELLRSTVSVLREDPMFKQIRVATRAPKGIRPFPLDSGQMQQVLVNLVLNALQAMNGSGEIRLFARAAAARALEIAVEDDGPGVPDEIAEEIFKPFFTTRRHGTGLGLAISRKIVESHGGSLSLERSRSGGARFVIHLPFPEDEPAIHTPMR